MASVSSRLIRQGSIYALGNVAIKVSGLLLAVIYLNPAYLSVEDFGYFSLLFVTSQFGIFFVGLGLGTGLMKFMADPAYADERPRLPFTTLVATVCSCIVGMGVFVALARPLAAFMLDDASRTGLIYLLAGYVVMKTIGGVPLMLLRVEERAGWYVAALLAEVVVLIAAAYGFVVLLGWGVVGLMGAYTVAASVSALLLAGVMLVRVPWRFDRRLVGTLMRFGAPLVLASFAGWFLNAGDRYLLKWLADATAVGLYEWAVRLASVLNLLLVQSFQQAFAVIGLKVLGEEGAEGGVHRATFRHFAVWGGWAALALALASYDLTALLPAASLYLEAGDLVLVLALGFMANGLYYVGINIIYGAGRTAVISLNILGAALLNVALNIVLIPWLGVMGAAIATLLSYATLAVGAGYFAQREEHVRFAWHVPVVVAALVAGLYVLGRPSEAWTLGARLGVRVLLLGGYPLLVLGTRLYTGADVRMIGQGLRRALGRPASTNE